MKLTKFTKFKQKYAPNENGLLITTGEALQFNRFGLTTLLSTILFVAFKNIGVLPIIIFFISIAYSLLQFIFYMASKLFNDYNYDYDIESYSVFTRLFFIVSIGTLLTFSLIEPYLDSVSAPIFVKSGETVSLVIYSLLFLAIHYGSYVEVNISELFLSNANLRNTWKIKTKGLIFTLSFLKVRKFKYELECKFTELFNVSVSTEDLLNPTAFLNYDKGEELRAIRALSCHKTKGVDEEVKLELLEELNSILKIKKTDSPDDIDNLFEFAVKETLNYYGANPKPIEASGHGPEGKVAVRSKEEHAQVLDRVRRKMEVESAQ